ncbi:MAG: type II toxin-antitoxin system Phd/YefM family antitoxin [Anaerolineales bacterium]|uniref:Antitoxin n=1 Tax=Candidatus Desulfolinea nitratireducens TaxID=2841698 RepID=A0A8J6TJ63_9CHLR|nr:type II toxin-antitoxin system Phd/YefM family antitoxin [Candidatus Desulfolinea nitratireducens]MBL6962172.1 type II toxin-antitoxin system Phd/YefM family antitoxin [Anaerolineales bacterium]
MTVFNIHEAKTHFSKLLIRVMSGEEIIIAKAGKPIVRLLPYENEIIGPRTSGIDKGKVIIKANFDEPLPEFEL